MKQINNTQLAALHKELFTGSLKNAMQAWLNSAGAGADNLMDSWGEYWTLQDVPVGSFNDRKVLRTLVRLYIVRTVKRQLHPNQAILPGP